MGQLILVTIILTAIYTISFLTAWIIACGLLYGVGWLLENHQAMLQEAKDFPKHILELGQETYSHVRNFFGGLFRRQQQQPAF